MILYEYKYECIRIGTTEYITFVNTNTVLFDTPMSALHNGTK